MSSTTAAVVEDGGTTLSDRQLKELSEAFKFFDKDGDGSISTQELGTVMRNLGHFPSKLELETMLKDIDIDGDGSISLDEFVQLMSNMNIGEQSTNPEDEEKELREAFKIFDKANTGYITASDLRAVIQCMGQDLTEQEIEEMIAEVDIDGDGRIDFDEFVAAISDETNNQQDAENGNVNEGRDHPEKLL